MIVETFEQLRPAIDSMQQIDGPDYIVLSSDILCVIVNDHIHSGRADADKLICEHVLRGDELAEHINRVGKAPVRFNEFTEATVASLLYFMRESNNGDRTFALCESEVPAFLIALIHPEAADAAEGRIIEATDP